MDFEDPARYIERPSMRSQVEDIELLFVPENRCTDWTWDNIRQFEFVDMSTGHVVTLNCTPNLEPVIPRYRDDNGSEFTERSRIELYYTWKQLDDSIIAARREELKKLRTPVTKTVSNEPKPVSQYKLDRDTLAKEFYDFAKKHASRLTTTKMVGKLKNGDSSAIAFNMNDDNCNIYGIGNIGRILMQAKSLFSAVDKPVVKLSTLKERLDEMTLRLRRFEFEIENQTKQLVVLRRELHSKEIKNLNLEELSEEEDNDELELEILELNKRETHLMQRLHQLSSDTEKLRVKIPELTSEIEERMENGGKPAAVQISAELHFVQKIIKLMNGWNHSTFSFLDSLNALADTFKPVEEKDVFFEELKKQDVVLNVRATRPARPAPVAAAVPVVAAPIVAAPIVAAPVVAAPVVAAVPVVAAPRQQARPNQQQPQRPARPATSRLARLGLKP